MICLHFWAWKSNVASAAAAPGSFSLNTNEAPTKTRSDIWLSKKSKKYFNTRVKNQSHLAFEILPKSGEGRPTKKSSKKDTWVIVMSLICLIYLDIFYYTSYYTPYLDPKLHHYQKPINSGWNYSRTLLAGTLFFFSTKVGFRANISILVKLQP